MGVFECFVEGYVNFPLFSLICCPWLTPCYYADNVTLIEGNKTISGRSKCTNCVSFLICSACCMGWLMSSSKRTSMRCRPYFQQLLHGVFTTSCVRALVLCDQNYCELRFALGIEEEGACPIAPKGCEDCCLHLFCIQCALVQERKILLANGKFSPHDLRPMQPTPVTPLNPPNTKAVRAIFRRLKSTTRSSNASLALRWHVPSPLQKALR